MISCGSPYEILLGAICESTDQAKRLGEFFVVLAEEDLHAVEGYLMHFIQRIQRELDLQSCELEVRPEFRHSPMDFPRPSPTRNFCLPAFFKPIQEAANLSRVAEALNQR
jgi:hypothetical protein